MKILVLSVIVLVVAFGVINAQEHAGYQNYSDYREIGEFRLWTIIISDSTVGRLISTVQDEAEIDDISGYEIEQVLKLDNTKIGSAMTTDITSKQYIADNGSYLGDDMTLVINGAEQKLEMERDGNHLKGEFERGGSSFEQNIDVGPDFFPYESFFYDQYESFLAARSFAVGDVIEDSVYSPQTLTKSYVKAMVYDYREVRLYNEVFDTCFVIHFTYPYEMIQYFTPGNRLVKIDIPSQSLKAYLDAVRNPEKLKQAMEELKEKKEGNKPSKSILATTILWLLYLLFGIVSLFFFIGKNYRNPVGFLFLIGGGLIFIVIPFTQIPLQDMLFKDVYLPQVTDQGGSPLVWGILPAAVAGIIQEMLKILLLVLLVTSTGTNDRRAVSFGALIGVGFGVVEACYLSSNFFAEQLFGVNLLERAFLILYHVTAGAILGYGIAKGTRQLIIAGLCTLLINSFLRYLPIFVQSNNVPSNMLVVLLAFISVILLLGMIILMKREEHT